MSHLQLSTNTLKKNLRDEGQIYYNSNISSIYDFTDLSIITYDDVEERIEDLTSNPFIVYFSKNLSVIDDSAFNNTSIINIKFPESLKIIGNSSFCDCQKIYEVDVKNTISVDDNSFQYCENLIEVVCSDKIKKIGSEAFAECIKLSSIIIPNTAIYNIGTSAFYNCKSLKNFEISSEQIEIGQDAFKDCSSLTCLYFYGRKLSEVKQLDNYPFGLTDYQQKHCISTEFKDITNLTLASNTNRDIIFNNTLYSGQIYYNTIDEKYIDIIENDITENIVNEKLLNKGETRDTSKKITILLQNVKTIDNKSFANIKNINLEKQYEYDFLSNEISSLGESAFYNCGNISNLIFNKKIISIGENAFLSTNVNQINLISNQWYDLYSQNSFPFGLKLSAINCIDNENVAIISHINEIPETTIAKTILIDSNIVSGEWKLKDNIPNATKLYIYNDLSIGEGFCQYHNNLSNISNKIKNNQLIFGKNSFLKNENIKEVDFGSCKELMIYQGSFSQCNNLSSISHSCNNIKLLGELTSDSHFNGIFSYCNKLSNIDNLSIITGIIPAESFSLVPIKRAIFPYVTDIGSESFIQFPDQYPEINQLEYVQFDNVSSIGDNAFYYCSKLKHIDTSKVKSIGSGAFRYSGISSLDIQNLTSINSYIAYECSSLVSVNFSDQLYTILSCAFYGTNISNLIHNNINYIAYRAFGNCKYLSTVILNNIETIDDCAFENSPLTSFYIPSSLIAIYGNPFKNTALNDILIDINNDRYYNEINKKHYPIVVSKYYWNSGNKIPENKIILSFDKLNEIPFGISSMNEDVWKYYSDVTSLIIPSSFTGDLYHLKYLSNLVDISVENGNPIYQSDLNGIHYPAIFKNCHGYAIAAKSNLSSIPNGLSSMDKEWLNNFINCTEFSIPSSFVGDLYQLEGMNQLEGLSVIDGNIRYNSFNNCNGIVETQTNTLLVGCKNTKFNADNIKVISNGAFKNKQNITNLTIDANNNITILNGAFDNLNELIYLSVDNITISSNLLTNCKNNNLSAYIGYINTNDDNDIFYNTSIKYIKFIDQNYINYNFSSTQLFNVDYGNAINIKSIENNNFVRHIIANNVEEIDQNVFKNCKSLTCINLNNVNTINDDAFNNCENLISVHIPICQNINNKAFYNCKNLINLNLPYLTSINDYTFKNCIKLNSIYCPKLSSIGNNVFENCSSLFEINISNLTSINDYTFKNCKSLSSINCKNAITIKQYAFENCAFTNIELYNISSLYEGAFFDCENLSSINLNNIKYISDNVFNGCKNLSVLDLTNSTLDDIKYNSFINSGIISVFISSNINSIDYESFAIFDSLNNIWNDNNIKYFRIYNISPEEFKTKLYESREYQYYYPSQNKILLGIYDKYLIYDQKYLSNLKLANNVKHFTLQDNGQLYTDYNKVLDLRESI